MRLSCLDNLDTLACNLQSQCQSCFLRTSTHWDGKNSLPIAFRSATGGRKMKCEHELGTGGEFVFSCRCSTHQRWLQRIQQPHEVIWSSLTSVAAARSWKRRFPVQTRNIWRLKLHQQNRMRKAPAICFKIYRGLKVLEEFCIMYVWLIISHFNGNSEGFLWLLAKAENAGQNHILKNTIRIVF